ASCLFVTSATGVEQGAVSAQQVFGGEVALRDEGREIVLGVSADTFGRALRLIFPANQHAPDALLQLADVSRPGIVPGQVGGNPAQHIGSNLFAALASDAGAEEGNQ